MEKMKCDIIQDLIPSYVDGVCSDATRECVKEHMESCEECRKIAALCGEKGISGRQMEQKELDGLKKIKRLIQYKGYVCCGLVIFNLGVMGIGIFGDGIWGTVFFPAHMVMFITCMCLVLLSGMGYKGKKAPSWKEVIPGAASVAIALYIVILNVYLIEEMRNGADHFWGMEMYRTGPFFARQIGLGHLVMLGFFLYHLIRIIRQDKNGNWLLCLDVAGCYIVSKCYSMLSNMSDPGKYLHAFTRETAAVAAIGLLGTVASVLIGRRTASK